MIRVFERFEKNRKGFWDTYRWLILVFITSLLCDAASTIYFMVKVSPDVESHPVIRIVSIIFGPIVGPVLSAIAKATAGILVAIYCRRFAAHIFVAGTIISFFAAWYNITYAV